MKCEPPISRIDTNQQIREISEIRGPTRREKLLTTSNSTYSQFMQIARIVGNVVATIKNSTLEGRRLMIIQTLDAHLAPVGKPLVAVDSVGAGVGELVFWCRGKEASFPFAGSEVPTDCTIVGIVDSDKHIELKLQP